MLPPGDDGSQPHLVAMPDLAVPRTTTYVRTSTGFTLDESIAPEVRWLITILYAIAGEERRATTYTGLRDLGQGPFDVACSYDVLAAKTGWTRDHIRAVVAAAEPLVTLLGSPRSGFRYRVALAMHTFSPRPLRSKAPAVLKQRRSAPVRQSDGRQIALGDEPLSPANRLKDDGLSSIVELKAPILSPANRRKDDGLSSTIELETTLLSPIARPKNNDSKENADGQQCSGVGYINNDNKSLAQALLPLYRRSNPQATIDSPLFVAAVADLQQQAVRKGGCDYERSAALLVSIAADPTFRDRSFRAPFAYLRAHVGELVRIRLVPTPANQGQHATASAAQTAWAAILERAEARVGRARCEGWWRPLRAIALDDGILTLMAPSEIFRADFGHLFRRDLDELLARAGYAGVRFEIERE